jgi:hypothetical protein
MVRTGDLENDLIFRNLHKCRWMCTDVWLDIQRYTMIYIENEISSYMQKYVTVQIPAFLPESRASQSIPGL